MNKSTKTKRPARVEATSMKSWSVAGQRQWRLARDESNCDVERQRRGDELGLGPMGAGLWRPTGAFVWPSPLMSRYQVSRWLAGRAVPPGMPRERPKYDLLSRTMSCLGRAKKVSFVSGHQAAGCMVSYTSNVGCWLWRTGAQFLLAGQYLVSNQRRDKV